MRTPASLETLVDQGVIQEVIRPLLSGKEADVYLVWAADERRVAKVYKEAQQRSFKHRADYTEGRKVRNTRQQRAMNKRSRYGRRELEAAWRVAEVDIIHRLHDAGVRVPTPFDFVDGVLVMELVQDAEGQPAPRLVDLTFGPEEAEELFQHLLQEVVRMLCAGVVHGDLSDFNVLISPDGPVLIDFPQAVDPAANRNARRLLIRDVDNLTQFLARYARRLRRTRYAQEMWDLYERGELFPDTRLTGRFRRSTQSSNTMSLLEEIELIERENRAKREALGLPPPRPARRPKVRDGPAPKPIRGPDGQPVPPEPEPAAEESEGRSKRRRRRRRRRRGAAAESKPTPPPPPSRDKGPDDDDPFDDLDSLLLAD
ncbi:MAG: phosphotransferase [Myxococcales bacterium]|nr:phosphotransferase [Myxococcales bacterium]